MLLLSQGLSGSGLVHQYSDPTSTYSRAYSAPKTKQVDSPLADSAPQTVPHTIEGSFHESEISSNLLHSPSDDDRPLVVAMSTENKKQTSPHKAKKSKQDKVIPAQEQKDVDAMMHHGKEKMAKEELIQKQELQRPVEEDRGGFGESKKKKAKPDDGTEDSIESHFITEYKDDSIDSNLDTRDNFYPVQDSDNLIPPNPFEEAPPVNPFDESKDQVLDKEADSNPFDESVGANPFDEPAGANPFDEPTDTKATDESQNTNKNLSEGRGLLYVDEYGRPFATAKGDDDSNRAKELGVEHQSIPFAIGRQGAPPVSSPVTAAEKPAEHKRYVNPVHFSS